MSSQRLSDVMSPAPIQVTRKTSIGDVAKLMREQDIGAVLVLEDGDALPGIVTDRDLVIRCLADECGPDTPVASAYTPTPLCLSPDADVDAARETMRAYAVRRVPVVHDGIAVGIVSLGDLAELRARDSVLGQISAAKPNR